jgi:hypothetical protein
LQHVAAESLVAELARWRGRHHEADRLVIVEPVLLEHHRGVREQPLLESRISPRLGCNEPVLLR